MEKFKTYNIPLIGNIRILNLEPYYLHATGGMFGCENEENAIIDILRSHTIKTNESLKEENKYALQNDDDVCLCDMAKTDPHIEKITSSFITYVLYSPTLVLSRNIEVYQPELMEITEPIKGTTNLYDEVRHQGDISLDHLQFITFPIFWQQDRATDQKIENLEIFKENMEVLEHEFREIPVKDIFTGKILTTKQVESQIKKIKGRKERIL